MRSLLIFLSLAVIALACPPGGRGAVGPVGLNWKGGFNLTTVYNELDGVYYSGSAYICITQTCTAIPSSSATWSLVASQGVRGVQGLNGPVGNTGSQGIQGTQGIQGIQGPVGGVNGGGNFTVAIAATLLTACQGMTSKVYVYFVQEDTRTTGQQTTPGNPVGLVGNKNNHYITLTCGSSNVWTDNGLVSGVQGPQGIQGPQGATGPAGAQGVQGIQGNVGATGAQGVPGSISGLSSPAAGLSVGGAHAPFSKVYATNGYFNGTVATGPLSVTGNEVISGTLTTSGVVYAVPSKNLISSATTFNSANSGQTGVVSLLGTSYTITVSGSAGMTFVLIWGLHQGSTTATITVNLAPILNTAIASLTTTAVTQAAYNTYNNVVATNCLPGDYLSLIWISNGLASGWQVNGATRLPSCITYS